MKFIILILYFLYNYKCYSMRTVKNKYLSIHQWNTLKNYIIDPKIDINIRNKINKIIYYYYDDWSYYKALSFKNYHYNKCKHISLIELYTYSNIGLIKAIKKYNGKSNFTNYADIYINGELYKGLTELYPISHISKYERKKKQNISDINFKNKLNTKFVGHDNWLYDKSDLKKKYYNYYNYKNYWEYNYENYEDFWEKIYSLKPFEIYLIKLKFDYFLKSKESNSNIAKKFNYSEEYIRITIKKILKKILKKNLKKNYLQY